MLVSRFPAMRRRGAVCSLVIASLLAACSGDDDDDSSPAEDAGTTADAAVDCWPVETTTPGGEVEIGTGDSFESMPDTIQFIIGTQGGTFLQVHARIRGLEPGNPEDFLDPSNPKTRFTGVLFDGTVVGRECPGKLGYVPSSEEGAFDRERAAALEFLPWEVGERSFDTEMTLVAEVIDADGRYARHEKLVFAQAPAGWNDDAGPGDGGPADGGPGDAGPDDAGAPDADVVRGAASLSPVTP
jgi:hypothetical protein